MIQVGWSGSPGGAALEDEHRAALRPREIALGHAQRQVVEAVAVEVARHQGGHVGAAALRHQPGSAQLGQHPHVDVGGRGEEARPSRAGAPCRRPSGARRRQGLRCAARCSPGR